MSNFFTDSFNKIKDKEEFYKTVFLNMRTSDAAALRADYYKTQFKSMGENVYIGAGVKIVNPQYISVGDNVHISDERYAIAFLLPKAP